MADSQKAAPISLEVFKEAKQFKEGALDKIYPGKFSMTEIYDLFKDQAEANRKLDEAQKQKRQTKPTGVRSGK